MRIAIGLFISVAIFGAVLELGLRFGKKYQTYAEENGLEFGSDYGVIADSWTMTYEPNKKFKWPTDEFDIEHIANSMGYREREVDWDTALNKIRLLAIGDSFTEGVGAPYEETWPRNLEKRLIEAYPELNPSVLNFGIAGSDPYYSYMTWKLNGKPLLPTHVILAINISDLSDYIYRGGMERFQADGTAHHRQAPLNIKMYKKSHLYRWYTHAVRNCNHDLIPEKDIPKYDASMLVDLNQHMQSFSSEADSAGTRLLMVLHPSPFEMCYPATMPEPRLRQMLYAEKNFPNIEIVSRFKELIGTYDCRGIGWPIDGHYNSTGYKMFADQVWLEINREFPNYFSESE